MKKTIKAICLLLIVSCSFAFIRCTPNTMPQNNNLQSDVDTTPIDKTLFSDDDDNHYRMGKDNFLNLPGMVMFKDQNFYFSGSGICFANKTSKVASIYCFDPLCEYEFGICSARFFWRICDAVYQKEDGKLYCLRTGQEMMLSSDGNLYAFSLDTMEHEVVFKGNGNELIFLQVQNNYVYFGRLDQDGYVQMFRYNVLSGDTELLGQNFERRMIDLYIRYDQIFVQFDDDRQLYLTDESFSFFEPTGLETGSVTAIRHGKCYMAEKLTEADVVDLYEYDIATKEKRMITTNCENYQTCQTVTAEYVYFTNTDKSKLSRCRITDGVVELLYDFSNIDESAKFIGIKVYDGDLYIAYRVDDNRTVLGKATHYGYLVNENETWRFVDFEQGRVLSNIELSK